MVIRHHPDDATLMSFAGGALPDAHAAVVACHMAFCPACARQAGMLEAVGAALLDSLVPAPADGDSTTLALQAVTNDNVRTLPGGRRMRDPAMVGADGLPRPLAHYLQQRGEQVHWRWLGPGIRHYRIALPEGARGELRLLKLDPGTTIARHGHGGAELTLVLTGSYRDELGQFQRGDVADVDEEVVHRPVIGDGESCICLLAAEKPAKFRGMIGRILQPLMRV